MRPRRNINTASALGTGISPTPVRYSKGSQSSYQRFKQFLQSKCKCRLWIGIISILLVLFLSTWYWSKPLKTRHMTETKFYWGPRGLLLSSSFRKMQRTSNRKFDLIVYRGDEWDFFVEDILQRNKPFKRPFIVVSAGSDLTIPKEIFEEINQTVSLPSECLAWFSTNVDLHDFPELHGRIRPLPIGLDFNTKTKTTHAFHEGFGWQTVLKPWTWFEFPVFPHIQERELLNLLSTLPDTHERKLQVYADFWVNKGYGRSFPDYKRGPNKMTINRKEAFEIINQNPLVVLSSYRLARVDAWRAKSQYMFEISLPGNGMDCYRTYEALVLGIIVITISSPLDPLFEGLPVVIVDSLDDITHGNLLKWKEQYRGAFRNETWRVKLSNNYWVDHILSAARDLSTSL